MHRLALVAALACCGDEPALRPLQIRDGVFVDGEGRERLFRGVNARVAGTFDASFSDGRTALEPIPPFGADDCRFLSEELGLNLLRLPINWSALEPARGQYDDTYLDRALALADTCAAFGMSTIVDLHQDAYSKEIGEDGAPLWAIVPAPAQLLGGPLTDLGARRTSPEVLAAFASLYADTDGLAGAYAAMAAHVAERMLGHPGAIALELQNEPVVLGDDAALDAFHRRIATAVRAAAPDAILLFEPDSIRNLTDFAPAKLPLDLPNTVYAPHLYTRVFSDGWIGEDVASLQLSAEDAQRESRDHRAALLFGEFGNDPHTPHGLRFIRESLAIFDELATSWAFWVYEEWTQGGWGLYDSDGTSRGVLRDELADILARPFPEAIAGRASRIAWDAETRILTIDLARTTGGLHQITLPRRAWRKELFAFCDDRVVELVPGPGGFGRPGLLVRCDGRTLRLAPGPRGG